MRNGVTLVELVVVAVVLGILMAVGSTEYIRVIERSKAQTVLSALAAIRSAQRRYYAQPEPNQAPRYASDLNQLDVDLLSAIPGWGSPSSQITQRTGVTIFTRKKGRYQRQTLGMTYGAGTLCGTFEPLQLSQQACVAD